MIVYRIQGHDGIGPYMSSLVEVECPLWMDEDTHQPTPGVDGLSRALGFERGKHIFGFRNMPQMFDWFGHRNTFEDLRYRNYSIFRFRIDPSFVLVGGHQVAFDGSKIERQTHMSWDFMSRARENYENKQLGIPTRKE